MKTNGGWQDISLPTPEKSVSFSQFSGWLIQCKLLDYILGMVFSVVI